jgi:hypothetical protein
MPKMLAHAEFGKRPSPCRIGGPAKVSAVDSIQEEIGKDGGSPPR